MSLLSYVEQKFPNDHSRQIDAYYYISNLKKFRSSPEPFIIDLGAGAGNTYEKFKKVVPRCKWVGLDIEDSRQVRLRARTDVEFIAYDGVNIPFPSGSVDVVFSRQVYEHVEKPEPLMIEISRVLKPGGLFMGSASQMEPFHSQSTFNYTYYGFAKLATDAGLEIMEFRPGVDAITLILRNFVKFSLKKDESFFAQWLKGESPLNQIISFANAKKPHASINQQKVRYCGHLCFLIRKPDGPGEARSALEAVIREATPKKKKKKGAARPKQTKPRAKAGEGKQRKGGWSSLLLGRRRR